MAKKKNTKKTNEKKVPAKPASLPDTINTEALIAARSFTNLPVLLKVCRLCEAKDGPFLNIFDADKVTAKKIETVMPFGIAENDDLPHKICFRCSAKVEELYEFIQKCIKTQENLRKALGNRKTGAKTKHRELWEEKLNQSNISNDDICDALIKKAMEGIKDIPLNPLPMLEDKAPIVKKATKKIDIKKREEQKVREEEEEEDNKEEINTKSKKNENFTPKDDEPIISLKRTKKNDVEEDEPPVKRITRLSNEKKIEVTENKPTKSVDTKETSKPTKKIKPDIKTIEEPMPKDIGLKIKQSLQTNNFSLEAAPKTEPPKLEPEPKPFDIMDSVSMIKVNGVGVLFQCKLCNRNFLKKEVVMSHACAKQGAAKVQAPKSYVPPETPKIPQTVKYITMNVNKEVSKPGVSGDKSKTVEIKQPVTISEPITLDDDDDGKPLTVKKPVKPKIGPASKVRRTDTNVTPVASEPSVNGNPNQQAAVAMPSNPMTIVPNITATITSANQASVQFPALPSLNSRYKLMPGPNNTFTLVEDKTVETVAKPVELPNNTVPFTMTNKTDARMHNSAVRPIENSVPLPSLVPIANNVPKQTEPSVSRPYPVGLIKSISAAGSRTPLASEPPLAFPTPAMKKQSYTVVQTGNPSKLLISTKPQPQQPIEEEVPKKKSRKSRNVANTVEPQKQPFSVTIEDAGPPPTDPGFFTFINVDPLLQPSYVLPTDNIIQESQISTSTSVMKQAEDKDSKYTCNMCNEKFSREKKLLAHIQSHYEKMDAEDQKRTEKSKKRTRK
ncbi:titin-like [Maniola jurtina]|uniref:titin-like n=1 Tax=Maniola jurtina TaxID=191418 RepID=UPI001E68EC44|nr:titin-like [Maniola jurtina]